MLQFKKHIPRQNSFRRVHQMDILCGKTILGNQRTDITIDRPRRDRRFDNQNYTLGRNFKDLIDCGNDIGRIDLLCYIVVGRRNGNDIDLRFLVLC